ncbi:hypothetical protein AVEN_16060-1, partial [Araneus ventricosus]
NLDYPVVVATLFLIVARVLVVDDIGNDLIGRQYLIAMVINITFEPVLNDFLVAFIKS